MLDSFPFILILGSLLGFLSGIGIGGGSLLILWLTIVLEMPQSAARGINLLFFLPSALIACLFRWKQGAIHWNRILPAIAAGCVSAAMFSWIGMVADTSLLKRSFGILLILTGLRELLYKPKEKQEQT